LQKRRGAAPGVEATVKGRRGSAPRPNRNAHNVKARGVNRRRTQICVRLDAMRAQVCTRAVGLRRALLFAVALCGSSAPPASCGGGRTLRRLFRFRNRAWFGPIYRHRGAQIPARTREPHAGRLLKPSCVGAERGDSM
jgi:hypothetical protein